MCPPFFTCARHGRSLGDKGTGLLSGYCFRETRGQVICLVIVF